MKSVQQRLSALREAMKKHGVDAFVIPSADPHLSEYLPEHWQARRDFSGFTGSAGTLVVTADKAGVWTDSRYWEQAGQQLAPNGIELQKMGVDAPYTEWLAQNLPEGAVVGAPADMFALSGERGLKQALAAKTSASNILKLCWTKCGTTVLHCRLRKSTFTIPTTFLKLRPKNWPVSVRP